MLVAQKMLKQKAVAVHVKRYCTPVVKRKGNMKMPVIVLVDQERETSNIVALRMANLKFDLCSGATGVLFAAQRLPAHPGANKPPTWS
jgi:hypothetical protein